MVGIIFWAIIFILFVSLIVRLVDAGTSNNQNTKRDLREEAYQKSQEIGSESEKPSITFEVTIDQESNYQEQNTQGQRNKSSSNPDDFWLSKGENATVQGYEITDGLIYLGQGLTCVGSDYYNEPALIDPSLPVDRTSPDYEGLSMGYWPSYGSLRPSARAAYLSWLETGRSDPEAYIGYVFLYYYGLERRLFADPEVSDKAINERRIIVDEIRRLNSVYDENSSFRRYSNNLLRYVKVQDSNREELLLEAKENEELNYSNYINSRSNIYHLDEDNWIGLSYFAEQDRPLPAEWALKFAYNKVIQNGGLRTPARRCVDKFQNLFMTKYTSRFGDGIVLGASKNRMKVTYHSASSGLNYGSLETYLDIPSVNVGKYEKKLVDLFYECTDQLDAYSRYLGRNPDDTNSVQALSNLPSELLEKNLNSELGDFVNQVRASLETEEFTLLETEQFTRFWEVEGVNKYRKKESIEIAQFLFKLGIGIEPDLRFGSIKFERNSRVVLFGLDPEKFPKSPSKEYKIALIILHLTTTLGMADGRFSEEEERYLDEYIENLFKLNEEEKVRLEAYLYWLKEVNPGIAGIKRRIEAIESQKRRSILQFLIKVANADGYVDPGEVEVLQNIASIFGLDPDKVYHEIHAHQASGEDPVLIMKGEEQKGYSIPSRNKDEGDDLDIDRINKTLKQTEEVQSILTEIFTEDDEGLEEDEHGNEDKKGDDLWLGLDSVHTSLIQKMIERSECSRTEFEQICNSLGLFPNGALEVINEAFYEEFEEDFLYDEDEIKINTELVKEINYE